MRCHENTTHRLHRRGREGDLRSAISKAELLRDLGCVAVAGGCIRPQFPAPMRVMRRSGGLRACGRGSDQRVDDDRDRAVDHLALRERRQREDGCRREAATGCDDGGGANAVAVQLREAVDRCPEGLRARMRPSVPPGIRARVAQTEVRTQIDEDRSRGAKCFEVTTRLAVLECREHHIGAVQLPARREAEVRAATKRRMDCVDPLPRQPLRRDLRHLDVGMVGKQTQQLTRRVSGATDDSGAHHRESTASSTEVARSTSTRSTCSSGV